MLGNEGFSHLRIGEKTGFNSSPRTVGTTISGRKPTASECCKSEGSEIKGKAAPESKKEFKVETLLEEAYELGCEEAKIIDPQTIVVGNWVQWKCRYGCALYDKDGCHPPYAPSAEETRKIFKEYSKAILMKGFNGSKLSEITIDLEGFAYELGYYKAFALIALPVTPGST